MKIQKIEIKHFRSIRKLEFQCGPVVVLLGPNNHGKSNILSALEFALTPSVKPAQEDFFQFRGDDDSLWVELTFCDLTEQEKRTFQIYILEDGTLRFRKTATLSDDGAVETRYNGYRSEPTEPCLQAANAKDFASREEIKGTPLADFRFGSGRITKNMVIEAQTDYIKSHKAELSIETRLESGPFLGAKNVAGGLLPEFYFIPAVRDLTAETKVKNTTMFGRLVNYTIRQMAERDDRFQNLKKELGDLIGSFNQSDDSTERPTQLIEMEKLLKRELGHWGVSIEIEVMPPELEKIFELGTNLHLNDGVKTLAEQKGHGLQRAVIFALFRAWASVVGDMARADTQTKPRASSSSVIFAMEEPELFLHPHAQRRLAKTLNEIGEAAHHQVFICSHSSHFVDLEKYKSLCIVKKPTVEEGTTVTQCVTDLFEAETLRERKKRFHMAHWVNPDRGEMFFARKVAFVEGETERTVLPYLAEKKMGCFDSEVSVIDCGSKHNLELYVTIANAFRIPYVVVHDEDPLRETIPDDWSNDKRDAKKRTFELNAKIARLIDQEIGNVVVMKDDFEHAAGVSESQGDKKGKALAALDYFESLEKADIKDVIQDLVRTIYCDD
ncbi:MAG: ATP-dependent endonuclease [Candidatus Lernaella stagnicola]|nr:ATP-dependent endonuclease [Candidatus Lernaella stagnicola]